MDPDGAQGPPGDGGQESGNTAAGGVTWATDGVATQTQESGARITGTDDSDSDAVSDGEYSSYSSTYNSVPTVYTAATSTQTQTDTQITSTSSSDSSDSSSSSNDDGGGGGGGGMSSTTKIAIAVPVAVVGAAIIAALIFFLLRRRRRQRQQRLSSQRDISTPQLQTTSSVFLPPPQPMTQAQDHMIQPVPMPGPTPRRPVFEENFGSPVTASPPISPRGGTGSGDAAMTAAAAGVGVGAAAGVGMAVTSQERERERDLEWRTSEERAAEARAQSPFDHPHDHDVDLDSDDAVSVVSDINNREAIMRARSVGVRDDDISSVSSFGDELERERTRERGTSPGRPGDGH